MEILINQFEHRLLREKSQGLRERALGRPGQSAVSVSGLSQLIGRPPSRDDLTATPVDGVNLNPGNTGPGLRGGEGIVGKLFSLTPGNKVATFVTR